MPIAKLDGSSLRYLRDRIAAKIDENARAIADTVKTCCTLDHHTLTLDDACSKFNPRTAGAFA